MRNYFKKPGTTGIKKGLRAMQNIFTIIIALAILSAGAALAWLLRRKGKEDAAAKVRAALDYMALEELIREALPWLMTQAEKLLGSGTGEIKRAWVVQEVMKLLLEGLRARLDLEHLDPLIDGVLEKLRSLWERKPGVVTADGILVEGERLSVIGFEMPAECADAETDGE